VGTRVDYASAKCPSIESSLGVIYNSRRKPDCFVVSIVVAVAVVVIVAFVWITHDYF